MRDEPGSHDFPDQRGQVRGHGVHLVQQVGVEVKAVLCQRDDPLCKGFNVEQIEGLDILAHRHLGRLQNVFGLLLVPDNLLNLCQKKVPQDTSAKTLTHKGEEDTAWCADYSRAQETPALIYVSQASDERCSPELDAMPMLELWYDRGSY